MSTTSNPAEPIPARDHTRSVLTVALVLRLLVLWSVVAHNPPSWFFMRGMEMGLLAKSLLAGLGLGSPFGPPTGPTAFIAPVYPILVAGVFKVFGADSRPSEFVIILAQIALNVATIALVMHIARRLFSQRAANIAGLFWAISPPLLFITTIFWETSFSTCLLTGLIALALHYKDKPAKAMWPLLGAYCGVTALVNPALLLSIIAIAGWLVWQHRRSARLWPLVSVLTFVIVFSPWPIRNARTFHAFIPLRTTVGFELWMGNHPGATGYLIEPLFPTFNQQELNDYIAHGELAYTNHKSELAKQYILAHPAEFLRLTALRTKRFWTGTGNSTGSLFYALHACLTSALGFLGLWYLYKSRRFALVWLWGLPLLLFPLPYMITHAEFRYRLILDPLLTILSAHAITHWQQTRQQRHPTLSKPREKPASRFAADTRLSKRTATPGPPPGSAHRTTAPADT